MIKHKIPIIPTIIVFLILTALIAIVVSCGSKPIKVNTDTSQTETYELYVLDNFSDGESRLTLYNNYKVKLKNITYSNTITTYNTTDGTQITFAGNGITVINSKGYQENFTQGYMRRK